MSEISTFVAKVQGTYDYMAELVIHKNNYLQEKALKAEMDRQAAKAQTDAAWARFIKEHA